MWVKTVGGYAAPAPRLRMDCEIEVGESVSSAVVLAVSAIENRHPSTLRPLADILDPEALDVLFDPTVDGTPRIGGRLSFVYSNCRIAIDNGEFLTLQPLESHRLDGTDRDVESSSDRDLRLG